MTPGSLENAALPPAVRALLDDVDALHARREVERAGSWDSFITSDYEEVWKVLHALAEHTGSFLEWGSGMGAITLMAAYLGFDAHGIEIQPALVETARRLAESHRLAATFACGTFFPAGFGEDPELLDGDLIHDSTGADAYRELGLALGDFDVVYAFPWPGEEELFLDLFQRGASPAARLICNFGSDGISVLSHR